MQAQEEVVIMTSENSSSAPLQRKLLDRVRVAMRAHHYSPRTELAYVAWIRHPRSPGIPEPQGREHDDALHPRPEPGAGGRPQPSRSAFDPTAPCSSNTRRPTAGRDRLRAPAAYPGEA